MSRNNWNLYGRSYEGLLVKSKHRVGELQMFVLSVQEGQSLLSLSTSVLLGLEDLGGNEYYHNDELDGGIRGAYFSMKMKNRNIPALEIYAIDYRFARQDTPVVVANHSYTLGLRSEILYNSFSFEGETALQTGDDIFGSLLSLNLK